MSRQAELPPSLRGVPNLTRAEIVSVNSVIRQIQAATPEKYSHEQVHGRYCTITDHIDAPPDEVWSYLADTRSLSEWSFTLRRFEKTEKPGVWISDDLIARDTMIYTRTESNAQARTVDYHCAWDQGEHLWMIYLMRVLDAQVVLDRPGSVVQWTNCHHPFYDENPFPETAPEGRPWIGDFWDLFAAGHWLELQNLKTICEYRHSRGLPITPDWSQVNP